MIQQESIYKIGILGKPHGVKGEVAFLFNDDVFDRVDADYLILKIEGIFVPFFMEEYRFKNNETALMKFVDIDTQEQARALTGCEVYFPRDLSDSTEDTLSWSEIIGYTLTDAASQTVIGQIKGVDEATVNVLFEVENAQKEMLLIPASEDFIVQIDTQKKTIALNLPAGILDLNK